MTNRLSPAPQALKFFCMLFLGFRCAPPQALRCHPLRGLRIGWLLVLMNSQQSDQAVGETATPTQTVVASDELLVVNLIPFCQ